MQSENLRNINLAQAAATGERLEFELTDAFFADLEQEEISGGKVHATLDIHASAASIYKVQIKVNGTVTVACDRCLEPLELEVEASEEVKVKDADPEENDAPELLYTQAGSSRCDLAWCLYEIIETSLPLQRLHPEGQCNEEMMAYIMTDEDPAENADEDED